MKIHPLFPLTALLCAAALTAPSFAATPPAKAPAFAAKEALPPGAKILSLEIAPAAVTLHGCFDAVQLLVTAKLANGDTIEIQLLDVLKSEDKLLFMY